MCGHSSCAVPLTRGACELSSLKCHRFAYMIIKTYRPIKLIEIRTYTFLSLIACGQMPVVSDVSDISMLMLVLKLIREIQQA